MAASKFTTAPQKIARALTQTECVGAWHQNGRKDDQMPQHFEQNTTGFDRHGLRCGPHVHRLACLISHLDFEIGERADIRT